MKSFNIYRTLFNRDAVFSTAWSFIQQLVVAASTYFILKAIELITGGQHSQGISYIAFFSLSLVLVYLPNTLSMAYLQRWRLSSFETYVKEFARLNRGKVSLGHASYKKQSESWLTNESQVIYDDATNIIYQLLSTIMNSVFNILVIAVALDQRLIGWYLAAGAILIGARKMFATNIEKASASYQESRKSLSNTMLSAWENIFTGNQYNLSRWFDGFEVKIGSAKETAAKYDLVRSSISSVAVCLALIIVALGNSYYLYQFHADIPKTAALLITMPRQLQIIQSIFGFFNLTLSWEGTKSQLNELAQSMTQNQSREPVTNFVTFDAIDFETSQGKKKYADITNLRADAANTKSGRWTLRGRNGAGKSTVLGLIKEENESAFYLPSKYSDLTFAQDAQGHSDGNRLLAAFEEIATIPDLRILLLDEWDANLDSENLYKINEVIDRLSESTLVIESRHR